jgi:hypothetical protein
MMFGKKKRSAANDTRDTLFGDLPPDEWPPAGEVAAGFPWSAFAVARRHLGAGQTRDAVFTWLEILETPNLETRHYLQAWHFLRQLGEQPIATSAKHVLGVVVEVALPEGLDLLAAYADHSARYYNYSGAAVIWDRPNVSLDERIDALLTAATDVVRQIGPWEGARPPAPRGGDLRISFLTPSGLHFGEGSIDAIANDPNGGRVVERATLLMNDLIRLARVA